LPPTNIRGRLTTPLRCPGCPVSDDHRSDERQRVPPYGTTRCPPIGGELLPAECLPKRPSRSRVPSLTLPESRACSLWLKLSDGFYPLIPRRYELDAPDGAAHSEQFSTVLLGRAKPQSCSGSCTQQGGIVSSRTDSNCRGCAIFFSPLSFQRRGSSSNAPAPFLFYTHKDGLARPRLVARQVVSRVVLTVVASNADAGLPLWLPHPGERSATR
jgi:hypothetical protein